MSNLTPKDHDELDAFLKAIFNDIKNGDITETQFTSGMAHVVAAVDIENIDEARKWFQQGRKFMRDLKD